jgi:hypothetical protein
VGVHGRLTGPFHLTRLRTRTPLSGLTELDRLANQADEPDGKNHAVLRKGRASLKDLWPAGYP